MVNNSFFSCLTYPQNLSCHISSPLTLFYWLPYQLTWMFSSSPTTGYVQLLSRKHCVYTFLIASSSNDFRGAGHLVRHFPSATNALEEEVSGNEPPVYALGFPAVLLLEVIDKWTTSKSEERNERHFEARKLRRPQAGPHFDGSSPSRTKLDSSFDFRRSIFATLSFLVVSC